MAATLISNVPTGRASGIIPAALGGGGRENIFLASSKTAPRPLRSFDRHQRWQPVTHSARSRRYYGKIGDSEQFIPAVILS